MKAFAVNTNTFLVMQSQSSRDKAGDGDVELSKDAAYGTSKFEWYVEWLITTWQPLKRIYDQVPSMTITCYKYCKIRHRKVGLDKIVENTVYALHFDPVTERMDLMTEEMKEAYPTLSTMATNLRIKDTKKDPRQITHVDWGPKKRVKKLVAS
jgi:hypothetical protein